MNVPPMPESTKPYLEYQKEDSIFSHNPFTASKDELKDALTYDTFSTPITDINVLINNHLTGYVYFGRDDCPFCLEFNKLLLEQFEINNNLLLYKFDTNSWRAHPAFQDVLEQYKVSDIPSLIKINSDGLVKHFELTNITNITTALHNFLTS